MNRRLRQTMLCIALCLATLMQAQTVIDLKDGAIRAKTTEDYKEELGIKARAKADSLAYVDHMRRALNALHEDSLDKAALLLQKALKTRPEAPGNYLVHEKLGEIRLAQGRYREAVDHFAETLKQKPDSPNARYGRAVCYYETGSLKAAEDDCNALVDEEKATTPLGRQYRFLRAAIHTKNKYPEKARQDLEDILRADPDNQSAILLLAGILEETGQPKKALEQLNLFVDSHPQNTDGLAARAALLNRMEQYYLAEADYDTLIRLQADNPSLYILRARVKLKLNKHEAAQTDLEKAVKLGVPRGEITALLREARK
ncbi:MAG: tetratricopeptide repeat protein [Alloprevotella sp.]|nr:tetratricopeptide repeat protein [Bacteroidales bacterium]MDD7564058.1 tetratricopeptide repeat protein [Prevotellamassilia sp.]MDY2779322.1 tetratricopeptide repeat protein [Alloprevotella sp.]MDY4059531.1 tetratricopeptide repeat protein [Alloprevotella sp.]MDY4568461.1 tetratricopeptide repeat protein [Alloprevotella sp.]